MYSYLAFNKAVNHAKVLIKGKTFTIDGQRTCSPGATATPRRLRPHPCRDSGVA